MIKKATLRLITELSRENYFPNLKSLKKLETKEDLEAFQRLKLKKLLLHAYINTTYYRKIFDKIGIIKGDKVDLSRFEAIPVLTKDLIRSNEKELISKDIAKRPHYQNSSGGSTGEPLKLLQDYNYKKWSRASYYYYYTKFLGLDEITTRKVIIWGSPDDIFKSSVGLKARVGNRLTNTVFFNAYRLNNETMLEYLAVYNTFKPIIVRGYASALYDFANFVSEQKVENFHKPKVIVSSAENLEDFMRKKIEQVFKSHVYNFYGSREVGGIAGECSCGHLHNFSFSNKLEIVNKNGNPVKKDEIGNILITNLHNYAMPLIRYEIQDTAVASSCNVHCGNSQLPTIGSLSGRVSNHFVTKDGGFVSGPALTLTFNSMGWVNTFQILQVDYLLVKIFIVLQKKPIKSDMVSVESKFRILMGSDCKVEWEFVKEIPKTKSGKHLYTRSLMSNK